MQEKHAIRVDLLNGNIFPSSGFGPSENEQIKTALIRQIHQTIKDRNLTQSQAGQILGIRQPHVSGLMRGKSVLFSVERLIEFLVILGYDVHIAVSPARKTTRGRMSIAVR